MNSACYVAVIAFIIHFFLNNSPIVEKMLKTFLFITVILFGTVLSNFVQPFFIETNYKETYKMNKFIWTLYVGSNYSSSGAWTKEDGKNVGWIKDDFGKLIETHDSINNQEDIDSYRKKLLYDRYKELLNNPSNIFELLCKKFNRMWHDFMYPFTYYNAAHVNGFVNTIFLNMTNFEYIGYFIITIIYFVNIIFKIFFKQTLNYKTKNLFLLWIKLFIIGCTLMLLIVECNNKYAMVMQPLFICICICDTNIYIYKNYIKKICNKIRKFSKRNF